MKSEALEKKTGIASERMEESLRQAEDALRENEERRRSLFENMLDGYAYCKMLFNHDQPEDFIYIDVNPAFERLTGLKDVVGQKVSQVIPGIQDSSPELFEIYGRVALTGKPERFETYLPSLGIWFSISAFSPAKEYFAAVFENITERKKGEKLLHVRMRLMEFATTHSLDQILQEMLDEVGEITGSPISFYHLVEADQQTLSLQAWSTRTLQEFCTAQGKGSHYPITEAGVWVDCVYERRPVIHNDYASLPHRKGMPEGHARVIRELVVPILRGDRIVAILGVGNKPSDYSQGDVELVTHLADVAWEIAERKRGEEELRQRTLELQQLTDTLEQRVQERTAELEKANEALRDMSVRLLSAQEDERKRIAGEIHDTIGACLGAIKFKVEGALQRTDEKNPAVRTDSLEVILPVIQEGMEECRRIQLDLRPSMLDDLGLLPTLSWFCRRFQTIYSGIRVDQEMAIEEKEVADSLKIVIYRIVQEAMNNIAKHSQADLVRLWLRKIDDKMELILQDNGRGFAPDKAVSIESTRRGLGLTNMRERVELSGGSFAIESSEGKGTVIHASWPLHGNG